MSYYDEDFYNETSEFDQQIYEFKQSILKSVKDEFISEMDSMRKENTELQSIKKDWKNIQSEYVAKHRQLEYEKSDLERKVKRERLTELMKDFEIVLYKATSDRVMLPKCDECDEQRRISFSTPSGKTSYEDCSCKIGKRVYKPEEYHCIEFYIERNGNEVGGHYRKRDYSDDGFKESSIAPDVIYQEGTKYEELPDNHWRTFFRSQDECQKYCNWLTTKESNKIDQSTIPPSNTK